MPNQNSTDNHQSAHNNDDLVKSSAADLIMEIGSQRRPNSSTSSSSTNCLEGEEVINLVVSMMRGNKGTSSSARHSSKRSRGSIDADSHHQLPEETSFENTPVQPAEKRSNQVAFNGHKWTQEFALLLNDGDPLAFGNFLRENCLPSASNIMRKMNCNPLNSFFPAYLELDGINSIISYWTTTFSAVPDAVFQLKDTKVKYFPDGGCVASCNYSYVGTQVLDLVTDLSSIIVVGHPSDGNDTGVLAFQVEGDNRKVRDVSPTSELVVGVRAKGETQVFVTGIMSFNFNANGKIFKIENAYE